MKKLKNGYYHYKICGLSNVYVKGIKESFEDGEKVFVVPKPNNLQKAIVLAVLQKPCRLNGEEIRFLRTELELTQSELAQQWQKDIRTIQRLEKEETDISASDDMFLRMLVIDKYKVKEQPPIKEVLKGVKQEKANHKYKIPA